VSEPRSPQFLVIGSARSGTTYLTRQLDLHPEISLSDPKEPHFLAFAGEKLAFTGPGDEETINRRAITDEPTWRELFAGPGPARLRGEGSVSTLYYHERAIENIRTYCPQVKMIVLLRDPVERAYSAHQYWTSRGFETETFSRALDLEDSRIRDGYHHIWHYTRMGRYAEQLAPFLDAFDRDDLLVLGYEDFMADRPAGLARCQAFLGVENVPSPEVDLDVNAGGQPRSRLAAQVLRRSRSIQPLRQAVKAVVPFAVRERIRSANLAASAIEPADRARLEQVFEDERRALAVLLPDQAPGWVLA